jgi:hypothetical protein
MCNGRQSYRLIVINVSIACVSQEITSLSLGLMEKDNLEDGGVNGTTVLNDLREIVL